jgi:hypothetical protein
MLRVRDSSSYAENTTLRAYTPSEFFKPKMAAATTANSFKDMIPTIEAIASLQRTAPTRRERAQHLNDLYSYVSDHILLLYTEPKHLRDFAEMARKQLAAIPTNKSVPEYEKLRETLEMFITLSG